MIVNLRMLPVTGLLWVCVWVNLFQKVVQAGEQTREHSWLSNKQGYATADIERD